jgi:hypothetical protein
MVEQEGQQEEQQPDHSHSSAGAAEANPAAAALAAPAQAAAAAAAPAAAAPTRKDALAALAARLLQGLPPWAARRMADFMQLSPLHRRVRTRTAGMRTLVAYLFLLKRGYATVHRLCGSSEAASTAAPRTLTPLQPLTITGLSSVSKAIRAINLELELLGQSLYLNDRPVLDGLSFGRNLCLLSATLAALTGEQPTEAESAGMSLKLLKLAQELQLASEQGVTVGSDPIHQRIFPYIMEQPACRAKLQNVIRDLNRSAALNIEEVGPLLSILTGANVLCYNVLAQSEDMRAADLASLQAAQEDMPAPQFLAGLSDQAEQLSDTMHPSAALWLLEKNNDEFVWMYV